mmetsp:Transcript_7166/g.14473  ORF Transcript_7166/g.14473 Transcript_7166/m.14473 type:complete len:201 (-) Transcript_7166:184-786(-)
MELPSMGMLMLAVHAESFHSIAISSLGLRVVVRELSSPRFLSHSTAIFPLLRAKEGATRLSSSICWETLMVCSSLEALTSTLVFPASYPMSTLTSLVPMSTVGETVTRASPEVKPLVADMELTLEPAVPALAIIWNDRSSLALSALTSMSALFRSSRWISALAETPHAPKVREALPQAERGREARSEVGRAATSTPTSRS